MSEWDRDNNGTPDVIQKPTQVTGDGGRREGEFIVWRDEFGNVVEWSTLDSDTRYAPLAWTQDANGNLRGTGPDGFSSPDEAKAQLEVWYETDSPEWSATRRDMIAAGAPDDDEEIFRLLSAGIDFTQLPGSGTNDPLDIVNTRSGQNIIAGPRGGGSGSSYGPYRYESRDVSRSSRSEAQAILDDAYQRNLGRLANKEEIDAFQEALNMMQEMNPSVSVIEGVSGQRSDSRTQTTQTGFDARTFAREYAMATPEYADTFAATTFMNALDAYIANPNPLDARTEALSA